MCRSWRGDAAIDTSAQVIRLTFAVQPLFSAPCPFDGYKTNKMKRFAPALAGVVIAALLAAPAAVLAQGQPDSVTGFKLPPAPSDTPQVQGPVVEGVPVPRVPRPTSTPTAAAPTIAPPSPAPSPAQPEAPVARRSPATPAASATAGATPRSPSPSATRAASAESASTETEGRVTAPSASPRTDDGDQPAAPRAERTAAPREAATASPYPATVQLPALPPAAAASSSWTDKWPWLLGGFVLAWLIAGLAWLWRQRHETGGRLLAPPIERPRPRAAADDATAEPSPPPADPGPEEELAELAANGASPLRCTLEATRLSLTLLNVTLSYRLTLHNLSGGIIRDITVGSDLVTAHASLPMNQQMAGAEQVLQPQHSLPLLLPGQNTQLSGELRLPIPAIHPLRRADAVMFVPLLRLRIDAQDLDQIVLQTVVIGQKPAGPGAGLRPFRLDLGPRVYGEIGHRLLSVQG